jgi:hypothetical protein
MTSMYMYGDSAARDGVPTWSPLEIHNQNMAWWYGVVFVGNINAAKYQNILDDNLWPVIARHFPQNGYYFQDDNALVHRARTTQKYLTRNNMNRMSWPAQSPDLNVIENVWLYIKWKLQTRTGMIKSNDDLYDEISQIWVDIPQSSR